MAKLTVTFEAETQEELDRQIAEEGKRAGRREYWAAVKSFAQEALDEQPDSEEAQDEHVWQSVDGSSWVIYTAENYEVLRYTEHDDAWSDDGLELDPSKAIMQIAFCALRADVIEELQRLRDAKREEAEAEAPDKSDEPEGDAP